MNIIAEIENQLLSHIALADKMRAHIPEIAAAAALTAETLSRGNKLLLAGNGGSAADAQHWAAEWVVRLNPALNRPALPAISLSTDTSIITATGNDIGYDAIFERQVEAFAAKGDLFVAISTSGNSPNLIRAANMAHSRGANVLGILGKDGGKLKELCDLAIVVPSNDTQRIQEMHVFIGHQLCELSERLLFQV